MDIPTYYLETLTKTLDMKRIAIDMDEVIADVYPKLLMYFERDFGWRPKPEEYAGHHLYHLKGTDHIRKYLHTKGFFADLGIIANSQMVIQQLQEHYEIFIVTAAQEFRYSLSDKHEWLEAHFPFISWKNYVMCGDKSIIKADYMIDDHIRNLKSFDGVGLLYTATHNIYEEDYIRVDNWLDIQAFFQQELAKEGKSLSVVD
jgi:5'(3')-deoxyribonucleotidase